MLGISKETLKRDAVAFVGEFVGTTMFLFLGLGGVKTALATQSLVDIPVTGFITNETIFMVATSMGLSLLITCWVFYRISGGLFNPAITLSLWLVGALPSMRAAILLVAQLAGGIAGSALVVGLTPGSVDMVLTTLDPDMLKVQGFFLEALLTALLVFAVLMLAAEKHKATYLAPVGIGFTLWACHLFGVKWTGCGMNPARSFGPSVIARSFSSDHWIYWAGPAAGSVFATGLYIILKLASYELKGQDDDKPTDGAANFKAALVSRLRRDSRAPVDERSIFERGTDMPHVSDAVDALAEAGMVKVASGGLCPVGSGMARGDSYLLPGAVGNMHDVRDDNTLVIKV
ncbi:aquaporin-like protein [Meredithblackwellia eburnea MCA 4105]